VVFVSHSTKDDPVVNAIRQTPESLGVEVWTDPQQLKPGDLLTPKVMEAIGRCEYFLDASSPSSTPSFSLANGWGRRCSWRRLRSPRIRSEGLVRPVLFPEEQDPQLIRELPAAQFRAAVQKQRALALGEVPGKPFHEFQGR
jgi:hypothetical protein